jgi:hypothetical protein
VGTRPFSQYDLFGSCESTQRHSSETRISLSRLCVTYAPIYYTIPLDFEYRISKISLHPRDHLCNFHPNVSGGASKEARGRVGERQSSRIKGSTCANPLTLQHEDGHLTGSRSAFTGVSVGRAKRSILGFINRLESSQVLPFR